MQVKLPFITLLLLISFASVNAVLFTPALPGIAHFFAITTETAQQTITWFLIGYTLGQLVYSPIANRFGRKPALYLGIGLQVMSSLLCVLAGTVHEYGLLVIARFLLALGSGVGLKMTFTLVNECYEPQIASQKVSYLMLAFAITPGLSIALGGVLNTYYGWTSCFYAGAIYGLILFLLVTALPETQKLTDLNALKVKHLLHSYGSQFKNIKLMAGGLLMGSATSFVYVFAALAPFIAINIFGMSSTQYGVANILPPIGLIAGSLTSARLAKSHSLEWLIQKGVWITSAGMLIMFTMILMHFSILFSLFLPMIIIYFGLCFIMANASTLAMSRTSDKAHSSAVMSFINMGLATLTVLSLGWFPAKLLLLPTTYLVLCIAMLGIFKLLTQERK
jgi:MFS family permease